MTYVQFINYWPDGIQPNAGMVVTSSNTVAPLMAQELWLRELTYKPGWAFELRHGSYSNTGSALYTPYPGPSLAITAVVPDTNHPEEGNKRFIHTFPIGMGVLDSREAFFHFVLYCVMQVEHHEAMEYLRAGGVRVKNPHPEPGVVLYG